MPPLRRPRKPRHNWKALTSPTLQAQLGIGMGVTVTALAGVLLFGLSGGIREELAYRDFQTLDHAAHDILECQLLATQVAYEWKLLVYQQAELEQNESLADEGLKDINLKLQNLGQCLEQVSLDSLLEPEQATLRRIQSDYQEFRRSTPWVVSDINGAEATSTTSDEARFNLFTALQQPGPQPQQAFNELVQDLEQLGTQVQQQANELYTVPLQLRHRDRLVILIFGSVIVLVVMGLTVLTMQLVDHQARLVRKLKGLARTDALTGIANRRVWDEEFKRALERARRSQQSLAVAILDLDYFKHFNDTYGHQAGDAILRDIAHLLQSRLREGDVIARYGGEEFALLLHGCSLTSAAEVIERMRPFIPYGQTFSAGLTNSDGFESVVAVLERADIGLYRAKDHGRNCTVTIPQPQRL